MKAVVYSRYGPPEVLRMAEVAKPEPGAGEVLVKIQATTVHIGDVRMRIPDPFLARLVNGLFRPRRIPVLGMELAGLVEAVGREVQRLEPGDEVFGFSGFGFGAYAEYICLPINGNARKGLVASKPTNLTFGEAAAVPGGALTALAVIDNARINSDQRVLIYGASGSVGSYAVQLAKLTGAEVTGVCSSRNLELVESLGATHVVDYTRPGFSLPNRQYDVVFDAVDKLPRSMARQARKPGGRYLNVTRDTGSGGGVTLEKLNHLKDLIEAEKIKPVIDRTYPMERIVEAHRYVEQGHKVGNVVITVRPEPGQASGLVEGGTPSASFALR